MWNIAIIEDEEAMSNQLVSYFAKFGKDYNESFSFAIFNNAETFLKNYKKEYSVVLMDINLPGMNGMECVKNLREIDDTVLVVFVTNLSQFAVDGYEVKAFDFVVKPISYYNFSLKLKRALSHLSSLNNYELIISTKDKKYFININQLIYIEIRNHTIIYHLVNEEIKGSGTLKSLYTNLKKHHFAFCNQCYLVNLAFVKGIDDGFLLINNEKIRIASSRKKSFMQEVTAYIGEI